MRESILGRTKSIHPVGVCIDGMPVGYTLADIARQP